MKHSISFLAILGIALISASSALGQGIQHRYSFDADASDSVGGANWTLEGAANVAGGSLVLDGSAGTRAQQDGSTIGINGYGSITLEMWATPNSAANSGFHTAAGFGSDPSGTVPGDYVILQTQRGDNNSRVAISISEDSSPWDEEDGANGPEQNDDMEHHYVGVITNSEISLYIDGAFAGSGPVGAANGGNAADNMISGLSNSEAWLGYAYGQDPLWTGSINEYRIYSGVPAAGEVERSFAAGPDGAAMTTVPEPASLVLLGLAGIAALGVRRK